VPIHVSRGSSGEKGLHLRSNGEGRRNNQQREEERALIHLSDRENAGGGGK